MISNMGGRAKVVKKAVAPAIRRGSFLNSSLRASPIIFGKFLIVCLKEGGFIRI